MKLTLDNLPLFFMFCCVLAFVLGEIVQFHEDKNASKDNDTQNSISNKHLTHLTK